MMATDTVYLIKEMSYKEKLYFTSEEINFLCIKYNMYICVYIYLL